MTDARIGRLVAACLHEAISQTLPERLEFYEHWLSSEGLRDGTIGAAPIAAVIGFLRTEGESYDAVMKRAGEYAAAWTIASLAPVRRRAIAWLPRGLRARAALKVAAGIVRGVSSTSRASTRVRGNRANVEVASSLFCSVRAAATGPLCAFYLAVALETLRQFGFAAAGRVERCHAVEGKTCLVTLDLSAADSVAEPAMAA